MVLVGLVGLQDPPRNGVREAVLDCIRGGISVRMLTGDHVSTAAAIAQQVSILDLTTQALVTTANEFDTTPEAALDDMAELPRVVARCTPESKVCMIRALHRRNRVVAMTGDGVNDAPALRAADVGVAMGVSGSDVTRQSSHIVLADDNFVSIVGAVREGRRIFIAIKRFLVHVLATNGGMALMLLVGLAFRNANNEVIYPQVGMCVDSVLTQC